MVTCRFCGSDNCVDIFDFADLPLGHPVEKTDSSVWFETLGYYICNSCYLVQTKHTIPYELLANENVILSNVSGKVSDHYKNFPAKYTDMLSLDKDGLVVEIGSSDGALLQEFRKQGFSNILGIDPALHPSIDYDVEMIEDFFTPELVTSLKENKPSPHLVIANFVIALIPDLQTFFKALDDYMTEGAAFVMEIPYFCDFISKFRVDGLAHLRCNWFTVHSLVNSYDRYNLEIIDLEHDVSYRGGTLRVAAVKRNSPVQNGIKYSQMLEDEKQFLSQDFFTKFKDTLYSKQHSIKNQIKEIADSGFEIRGYGGGIKASTIINWLKLTDLEIIMTVDIDPNKHNRFIPLTQIPIYPLPDIFEKRSDGTNIAILMLAIDHIQDVVPYLKSKLIPGDRIVYVLPAFMIEDIF